MSNGRHRRISFGGLLLITLGVLLLANNFLEDFRAIEIFATYWPVLLILWGLFKLIDNLQARSSGQPAPRSLTGGDIFLLILVILIGVSLSAVWKYKDDFGEHVRFGPTVNGCMVWVGEQDYTFDEASEVREVKPGAQIRVDAGHGAIRIVAVEGNQLKVTAKKSVCATSERRAGERAKELGIEIQEEAGGYTIRPRGRTGERIGWVDLEISVPKKVSVTARNDRGAVQVNGIEGNVVVESQRGDVEILGVTGDVETEVHSSNSDTVIRNVKGNVKLTGRGGEVDIADVTGQAYVQGEFYGGIKMQAVGKEARFLSRRTDLTIVDLKGRLEIGGGTLSVYDAGGSMTLVSRERDVEAENVRGTIRIENKNAGDVTIRYKEAPRADATVMTDRGDISVELPAKSAFEVSAFSRNGEVETDFSGPELKSIEANRDRNIEGRIGSGGPKLMLRTSYGTIQLRKQG